MANTYTLISSVTVGSGGAASIDFTSIPATYTDLLIKLSSRSNSGYVFEFVGVKFNDSTTNYSYKYIRGNGASASSGGSTSDLTLEMSVGGTATASTFGNMEIYIPNYAGSNYKSVSADGVSETNGTTAYDSMNAALWSNTAAITKVTLFPSLGGSSWQQYTTAYLYGIKNS